MANKDLFSKEEESIILGASALSTGTTDDKIVKKRIDLLKRVSKVIKDSLQDGIDYMTIGDSDKPFLMKPGANKIALLFGITAEYEMLDKTETISENLVIVEFVYKCRLFWNGVKISENEASCNSEERSWGKEAENPLAIKNSIRQKAQKRAYVQALLLVANIGELFTLDIEEIKRRKDTEEIGQKQLMVLYKLIPTNQTVEKLQQEERRKRRKELAKAWSKKYPQYQLLAFDEVTKSNYELFKSFIKDFRNKWAD